MVQTKRDMMNGSAPRRSPGFRAAGVTLMEVIFAIGVILTGLVGIAALIPLAAENAQATMELDRSVSESTSSAATGLARAFNDTDSLVIFDKPAAGSNVFVVGNYGFVPSSSMRTVHWKTDVQSTVDPPINGPLPGIRIGKLETPGYGHMPLDSGLSAGICIDPFGMPDPNLSSPAVTVANTDSAFDYSRFPYYGERYAVLSQPNDPIGAAATPSGITPQWPMSPRMWRATLKSPMFASVNPVLRQHLISAAAVENIFRGSGGLSELSDVDRDQPQSLLMSQSTIGGYRVDSARDSSSDYTWFVTIAPPFLGGNTFRQSVVVVRKRQSPVPKYVGDPLALKQNSYAINDPKENPASERVAWVGDYIGFVGGAGGQVQLYGSQAVSDEIEPGQWVMLSRQPHVLAPVFEPTGPAVHRWYRVLRVEQSEQVSAYPWPGGAQNVWRRWVSLAGPDWAFQDEPSGVNTTHLDDTFCTIVTGAVSVIESDIVLE